MITFKVISIICLTIILMYFLTEFIFGFKNRMFKNIFGAISLTSVIMLAVCIGELT